MRNLKSEEYNAIIAGLRALQMVLDGDPGRKAELDDTLTNSGTEKALCSDEIDDLVDALQYGEVKFQTVKKQAVKKRARESKS